MKTRMWQMYIIAFALSHRQTMKYIQYTEDSSLFRPASAVEIFNRPEKLTLQKRCKKANKLD